jgi:hypothetical protein
MNDTELDELLSTWKTPPVPASLREGVRASVAARRRHPLRELFTGWRLLIAGTAVAAVVFLLADTSAFPEKVSPPPYTVDSEIIMHPGSEECVGLPPFGKCWLVSGPKHALMTSYNQAGSEVLLSWSAPDEPLKAAFWATKLAVSGLVGRLTRRFLLTPDEEAEREDFVVLHSAVGQSWTIGERVPLVNSSCRPSARRGEVVGQEVILNYPTIMAHYDFWKTRITVWMAPQLSCFALRATVESQQPDGSWTLMSEKKALKVTVNR